MTMRININILLSGMVLELWTAFSASQWHAADMAPTARAVGASVQSLVKRVVNAVNARFIAN